MAFEICVVSIFCWESIVQSTTPFSRLRKGIVGRPLLVSVDLTFIFDNDA